MSYGKQRRFRVRTKFDPLDVEVLAIDGKSGSGKGTARHNSAVALGWHELDSGVLYRAVGWQCHKLGVPLSNHHRVANRAKFLDIVMCGEELRLDGVLCTEDLRSELASYLAKTVAQIPEVRTNVMVRQLGMRLQPGLSADGRDMWHVFRESRRLHRFFLKADVRVIAQRVVNKLHALNRPADFRTVLAGIERRDHDDIHRAVSPLEIHPQAHVIDTTEMTPQEVVDEILRVRESNNQDKERKKIS